MFLDKKALVKTNGETTATVPSGTADITQSKRAVRLFGRCLVVALSVAAAREARAD